jgi:hypothetical protein
MKIPSWGSPVHPANTAMSITVMRHTVTAMITSSHDSAHKLQPHLIIYAPPEGSLSGEFNNLGSKGIAHPQGGMFSLGLVHTCTLQGIPAEDLRIKTVQAPVCSDEINPAASVSIHEGE